MKKEEKERIEWPQQVQSHRESCRMAERELARLDEALDTGADVQPLVSQLQEMMQEIRQTADHLCETLVVGPAKKVFSIDRINLSSEQYHLLQAAGAAFPTVKSWGICDVDDFELYAMCVYEDDEKVCFMAPDETPEVDTFDEKTGRGRIRLRMACSPEELKLKHLRPEQRAFFEKYRPDVIQRMQQE